MKKNNLFIYISLFFIIISMFACDLEGTPKKQVASSGVQKANIKLKTGADGKTVEQKNVIERLKQDNIPGSIKHFYVISPYSGQVIIYSTVRNKVTSSGKRLAPYEVRTVGKGDFTLCKGFDIYVGGNHYITDEVLQDDGTYGHSVQYIFWWDSRGIYHQHFFTGGQIIHLSDQPLPVKNITINLELTNQNLN